MIFNGIKKAGLMYTVFLMLMHFGITAQETSALHFLSGIHQSSIENPAIQNSTGKLVIGLPFLSGVYADWNASVPFNALFSEGFNYSFHRFYDSLDDQGDAWSGAGISMFFASLQHKKFTFSLSVAERGFSAAEFDREIIRFIRDGTMDFYGVNENLGSASFFIRHYREVAPGISLRIRDWLDIGIRPKILFAKLNFETEELNFSVETVEEKNRLLLKPEGSFVLTGPFLHERDTVYDFSRFNANFSPGDYFFQLRNLGMAMDLGVVFRPDKFSEWSLSLIDAGLIGFKHNSFDVAFERPIKYSRFTPYQSHTPDNSWYREPREALRAFGDSVSYIIDVKDSEKRTFSFLPLKLNARFKYKISEKTTAGVSNQLLLYRRYPQNRFSPYLEILLFPRFRAYGNLTLLNSSALLPGLGFSYTGNNIQFFCAGNNIPGFVKPASAKHLNLCVGVNLLFDTQ
jgi:hypothetical protein